MRLSKTPLSRTALGMPVVLPLAIALVAATGATTAAPAQVVATAASGVVQVNTGRGRLVTLTRPMSDIFVADDGIADVQVRSPTQLYIFGKKTGETTISATAKGGAVVYSATVRVGNNYDSVQAMLGLAMPEARIVATPMNGLVLLTGTVAQPEDAAEAEKLVQAYVGEQTKVLSRLKTATPLQVNLQVRIAEVSRSFSKTIGSRLTTSDGSGSGFLFGSDSGTGSAGTITYTPTTTTNPVTGVATRTVSKSSRFTVGSGRTTVGIAGRILGTDILSAIDLGETLGQVTTLANPNLTALSGETATFLAGGEIPIPISQGLGAVSVEFKQYGISLAYTPTVLSDGRISLRVRPEVSQLSSAGSVQINGTTIPALTTRRAETTLELGSGQSMMIGGLLQNSNQNSIDKTPGLGDLPVLGALFRSNGFQRNETELVIVITPYLVKPVDNQRDIVLPTDGYKAPTDLQRVFLGELGSGNSGAHRPVPVMAPPAGAPRPTIGAVATVPVLPQPEPRRAQPETKSLSKKQGAVAPGFSN